MTLSACAAQSTSATSFTGAKKQAQAVIATLSDVATDRDAATLCRSLLTPQLAAAFAERGDGSCARAVSAAINHADYTRLVVDAIELNGTDAAATRAVARTYVQKDGPRRAIVLVRANPKSAWRIDAFSATATPPAATTPA
jgi:hypothetical protein